MKINVTDNSKGAEKVAVRIIKKIKDMQIRDIIKELNLFNEMIDYHYAVCDEYKNVDDLYSQQALDYMSEIIYEAYHDDECDYDKLCRDIMDMMEDNLVDEIYALDENMRAE